MRIENLEIKRSRYGVHSLKINGSFYTPVAVISYVGHKPSKKKVYLDGTPFVGNKRDLLYIIQGYTFFALQIKQECYIYDATGNFLTKVDVSEYGSPAWTTDNGFVYLKDKTATQININGKVEISRELTKDELEAIGIKG